MTGKPSNTTHMGWWKNYKGQSTRPEQPRKTKTMTGQWIKSPCVKTQGQLQLRTPYHPCRMVQRKEGMSATSATDCATDTPPIGAQQEGPGPRTDEVPCTRRETQWNLEVEKVQKPSAVPVDREHTRAPHFHQQKTTEREEEHDRLEI